MLLLSSKIPALAKLPQNGGEALKTGLFERFEGKVNSFYSVFANSI